MSLATRLKQARQKKKLTQADLAVAVGIKQQAIQRIEAGKVKSTSYIVQLAKVLDVTPEWLALGDEAAAMASADSTVSSGHAQAGVPLIEWRDLSSLSQVLHSPAKTIVAISRVGPGSFAVPVSDESMHGSDGAKIGFHRDDILLVDAARQPHDGDFVIAKHHGQFLFRQYVNDGNGAYLRALNSHYESVTCDSTTQFVGVVAHRITNFV